MNQSEIESRSWRASLRRIAGSLLGLAHSRLELFAVELCEEKLPALDSVLWLGLALALGTAGLLMGPGAFSIFLWEAAGYAGLVGLALVAFTVAVGIVAKTRRRIKMGPGPDRTPLAQDSAVAPARLNRLAKGATAASRMMRISSIGLRLASPNGMLCPASNHSSLSHARG